MTDQLTEGPGLNRKPLQKHVLRIAGLGILLLFGFGLTRELAEPWTGLHDWNGAFFSQLARNQLRYPTRIHHGMPLVAVGSKPPPVNERSIYATHPPALVWLVAATFSVFGDSEISARLLPIACSFTTLYLLMTVWQTAFGRAHMLLAAAFYTAMPMAVYFGRMVDHEAVCLCLMAVSAALWSKSSARAGDPTNPVDGTQSPSHSLWTLGGIAAAITLAIWVDWPGCLFAVLFWLYLLRHLIIKKPDRRARYVVLLLALPLAAAAMLTFLVYAGLEGRWIDLLAIFHSRATIPEAETMSRSDIFHFNRLNTETNLTRPLMVLIAIGLTFRFRQWCSSRRIRTDSIRDFAAQVEVRRRHARAALGIIAWTGLIWLAIFMRQYAIHQYWACYAGPAFASLAAAAILGMAEITAAHRRSAPAVILAAAVVTTLWHEIEGAGRYFNENSPTLETEIQAWRELAGLTNAQDRIVLFRDPTLPEQRGGYTFRNIVPPQFAYYLDRAFTVESDIGTVKNLDKNHALFAIQIGDAIENRADLQELRIRYPEQLAADWYVIYDLRHPRKTLEAPPLPQLKPSTAPNP